MKKILIIGQAPPLQKQSVPYDTTLLYEMFSWVGISKEQAQEMFEFDAVTDVFPGKTKNGGHANPSMIDILLYYHKTLSAKIKSHDKIILLGKVPQDVLIKLRAFEGKRVEDILLMIHPSRRNYSKIIPNKDLITKRLNDFIWNNPPA